MSGVLVIGRSGQLARTLADTAAAQDLPVTFLGRPEVDLRDARTVRAAIERHAPSAIINTAAYTAVDKAESEPDLAFAVNRDGARAVAEAAAGCGARFIHVSTDYVFSGQAGAPYREDDEPAPINVYGASKLAGEEAVLRAYPGVAIVRTSGLFSVYAPNFVATMIGLAATRDTVRIVNDQVQCPTFVPSLAEVLLRLAATRGSGIFHAAGAPAISWAGFAGAIFDRRRALGLKAPTIEPVPAEAYGAPARRPAFSALADTRLAGEVGTWDRDWRPSLIGVVDALSQDY